MFNLSRIVPSTEEQWDL